MKPKRNQCAGPRCPAEHTLEVIGGTWKVPVLWHLARGPRRFSDLRRDLGDVTAKVLTQQLRELEGDGVVSRKVYAQVPPKVEYALTARGLTLLPIVQAMCRWGSARTKARAQTKRLVTQHRQLRSVSSHKLYRSTIG